jgi:signal transduction histidine kinase
MKKLSKTVYIPALLVFLSLMSIVLVSFFSNKATVNREKEESLLSYTKSIEERIADRFKLFDEKLRSGVGLFLVEDSVSKEEWRVFINSSGTLRRFPGALGIGYSEIVSFNEINEFESFAKKEYKDNFEVYPKSDNDFYSVVTLIQPESERNLNSIGFDMYSEEYRRRAMDLARDSGDSYISNTVNLVFQEEDNSQSGFLIYTPHYSASSDITNNESRKNNLEGYVFAVFKSSTYLENLFIDRTADEQTDFKISAGENFSDLLYKTSDYDINDREIYTSQIDLPGVTWKIDYKYNPDSLISSSSNNRPNNILFFGMFTALSITAVVFLLLRGKSSQLLLEQEREINEAKDSLLSIASHQLRTPATGVKQYIGMLLQGFAGDLTPTQENFLRKAYSSNERQLKTINDVLYLARIDSGRIVLSKKRVEVNSLILSLIDELDDEIKKNNHKIKTKFPKNKVYLYADSHMLRMIVENLITNSIKYTKTKGKIIIELKSKRNAVEIIVTDNGVGIDKKDYDKVFEQFTRLPNELSKTVSGTGVGLYLTKHLVELHGGNIEIESNPGEGSVFFVKIPKNNGNVKKITNMAKLYV